MAELKAQWLALPSELSNTPFECIPFLSIAEIEGLFFEADKLNILDDFTELFWAIMSSSINSDPSYLQSVLFLLEDYKRATGRKFNQLNGPKRKGAVTRSLAIRYNTLELCIRRLVKNHGCKRRARPYLLTIPKD